VDEFRAANPVVVSFIVAVVQQRKPRFFEPVGRNGNLWYALLVTGFSPNPKTLAKFNNIPEAKVAFFSQKLRATFLKKPGQIHVTFLRRRPHSELGGDE
jgi:hypothetical protein